MILRAAAGVLLAAALSGCSGALPWNDQTAAGMTRAEVEIGTCAAADGTETPCIRRAEVLDGKERQNVALTVVYGGVSVTYTAQAVEAFDGQRIRGAVENAVSDAAKEVAPDIVESVVRAVKGVLVP